MNSEELEVGKIYVTSAPVKVCFYDYDDCLVTDRIDLSVGTELTYFGADADGGDIFTNDNGTKYCFHADDLAVLEAA